MIEDIVNWTNSKGRYVTDSIIIENAFWFNLASYISIIRPTYLYNNEITPITFMGITIANSAGGKSFAHDKTFDFLEIDANKWEEFQEKSYISEDTIQIEGKDVSLKDYLPEFVISSDATKEGIHLRARASVGCAGGSVNITVSELFDYMSENINITKELSDGKLMGKIIKGSVSKNIVGIVSNLLLFGSVNKMRRDKKIREMFRNMLESGMYRRTFIYSQQPKARKRHSLSTEDFEKTRETINENINHLISKNIEAIFDNKYFVFSFTAEAEKLIDAIYDSFEDFEKENYDDPIFSGEIGSMKKILSLAALHAIIIGDKTIDEESVEYAYSLHIRCRDSVQAIFESEPQHKRFYEIIKRNSGITKSEITEKDDFDMRSWKHDVAMLEELCYRRNAKLAISGSKIEKYSIESLPISNLNEIIISIPAVDKKEKSVIFKNLKIPFSEGQYSLVNLIRSDKSCYCCCHFSDKGEQGPYRLEKYYKEGCNLLSFDIDDGFSIESAKEALIDIKYILYTTKSHQKEKRGIVCDRFRILIPTKYEWEVDSSRHAEFYNNIAKALGFQTYDISTLNAGRLFFTQYNNLNGDIFMNETDNLFDPLPFLPETDIGETVAAQLSKLPEPPSEEGIGKRIYGIKKYFLTQTYDGNRNVNLYRMYKFIEDLAGAEIARSEVLDFNSMLSDRISEKEVMKITRNQS